ncbi:hypothetical protein NCCP2145_23630 [Pseudarthrobacter sp. NCCP-2145]|nr:hypothetical protein NCCP2145_23630 [Pseudarthrobacter sp. NCCP-2145]
MVARGTVPWLVTVIASRCLPLLPIGLQLVVTWFPAGAAKTWALAVIALLARAVKTA